MIDTFFQIWKRSAEKYAIREEMKAADNLKMIKYDWEKGTSLN